MKIKRKKVVRIITIAITILMALSLIIGSIIPFLNAFH